MITGVKEKFCFHNSSYIRLLFSCFPYKKSGKGFPTNSISKLTEIRFLPVFVPDKENGDCYYITRKYRRIHIYNAGNPLDY